MAKIEDIIKEIESLNVMELAELVKALEEKFGVSAAMPVAAAPAAGEGATEEGGGEEKTSFTAVLTSGGENKIQVIKVVREVTGVGLKEAKDLVDSAPKPIKENIGKEEAEEIKKKIEEAGGAVEIK